MNERNQTMVLLLIDYSKTFYCVKHKLMWRALDRFGIPPHITNIIKTLYENQKVTVHIKDQYFK